MLAFGIIVGGFCLAVGVGYPAVCAIIWALFFRDEISFRDWMRDC